MAILSKGTTYSDGDQVTSTNLNALVDSATFASGAVDDSSTQLSSGAIIVKDLGIATGKIAASAVTTAKIADSNVTKAKIENLADYKVLGNVSGGAAAPAEVAILDEDNMSSDSATSLATQQSIKAYVDTQITAEDLDFAGDSGSSSVDLDSQTFTIAGSTGLDTTASGQTLTVALDLNEVTTETSIAQDDFVIMVDNTDSANGKITFSNIEDTVFGNVSGAVAIAAGGAATVSAVTVADESSDTTCFPLFATAATGSLGPKSGSNLTFNSSSGLLTATTLSGILADGVTATTQSASDNSTKVATTAYVDAQVGTSDTLAEVLANGNTTGSTNIVVSNGQSITTNTISETTSGSGVTIDGVLVKDNGITASGTISLGATSFNDNDITNVGSIALDTITNDGTDVTIDSSGDITLDAGGADIRLKDDGTQFGRFANSSSNLVVASSISDKDILFQGSDGGATITALTLDMSAAGAATFNDKITAVGTSVFTNLDISGDIDVDGTTNLDVVDIDGAVDMASTLTVADDANFDSGTLFVDASADRVGVGTTSPSYKLHLTEASTDFAVLIANSTSSGNGLKIDAGDNSGDRILQLSDKDGNEKMRVGATGLVGIGNTSPSSTLDVTGTLAVSDDAAFDTDTLFVDASADKVGINDSTPSEALDVSGSTKISSQLYLKRDSDAWTTSNTWINVNDFGVLSTGGSFALTLNGNGYRGTAGWTSFGQNSQDGATQIHQFPQGYMTFNANSDWPTTTDGTNKVVTERMRIHGDGNVSIGTTSASHKLDVNGTGRFVNDLTLDEDLVHNRTGAGAFPGYSAGTFGAILEDGGSNGSTLYMSRKNSWVLYLATDTTLNAQSDKVVVFSDLNGQSGDADNIVGDITITSSSTAFNTSSDYRLKENEVDITDGIDRLKQLKPYRFNFKRDADTTVDGFFAHEVSDIVPEAITGTKDAMKDQEYEVSPAVYEDVVHPAVEATYDENGQEITPAEEEWTESVLVTEAVRDTRSVPDYQGIDQSKLVPLLTAALQEAVAKIEALEARVQTLEG